MASARRFAHPRAAAATALLTALGLLGARWAASSEPTRATVLSPDSASTPAAAPPPVGRPTAPTRVALPDSLVGDDLDAALAADRPDTSGVRIQMGVRGDMTNESYYEDAFVDTTFLGRQWADSPESRTAGVLSASWAGTRNGRATRYRLDSGVSLGDRLSRGLLGLYWRGPVGPDWTLTFDPSAEYRQDRTFDRDLREWRGAVGARARRRFADDFTSAELGLRGDLLRARGEGSEFLLDRNSAAASASVDHLGLLGDEWRVDYRFTTRAFPDSSERDHFEHFWEGRWKRTVEGGGWVALEGASTRRVTVRESSTSRDNFWIGGAALEASTDLGNPWGFALRAEGEATRYDVQDSILFFDYRVVRGRLDLRREAALGWTVRIGPRVEALFAPWSPGEGYQELGGALEVECLGRGAWWSLEPSAGWRDYDEVDSGAGEIPGLHSSYAFYQLDLIADQAVVAGVAIKTMTALRWEFHVDSSQDARSVYVSVELAKSLR